MSAEGSDFMAMKYSKRRTASKVVFKMGGAGHCWAQELEELKKCLYVAYISCGMIMYKHECMLIGILLHT